MLLSQWRKSKSLKMRGERETRIHPAKLSIAWQIFSYNLASLSHRLKHNTSQSVTPRSKVSVPSWGKAFSGRSDHKRAESETRSLSRRAFSRQACCISLPSSNQEVLFKMSQRLKNTLASETKPTRLQKGYRGLNVGLLEPTASYPLRRFKLSKLRHPPKTQSEMT